MRQTLCKILLAAWWGVAGVCLAGVPPRSPLPVPLVDLAGVINPVSLRDLATRLDELAASSGVRVQVLILPDAPDAPHALLETLFAASTDPAETALLLLLVRRDLALYAKANPALEARLPSAALARIREYSLLPRIQRGDWEGALDQAVSDLDRILKGGPPPAPPLPAAAVAARWITVAGLLAGCLIGAFVLRPLAGSAALLNGLLPGSFVLAVGLGSGAGLLALRQLPPLHAGGVALAGFLVSLFFLNIGPAGPGAADP